MTDSTATPDATPRRMEYRRLDTLKSNPKNPKSHDLETIDRSYSRFGVVDPVTIDGRTDYIISGHGRTTAMMDAYSRGETPPEGVLVDVDGMWLVPVNAGWSSKNDAEAAAALIAMNRLTEMGGWVDESLLELLEEISESGSGFDGIGFSDTDMDDLRHLLEEVPDLDELAGEWDPDAVPNSGGAAAVQIKLTDPGLIALWHETRDAHKNDDEAFRALVAAAGAEEAVTRGADAGVTPRSPRASDPTVSDLEEPEDEPEDDGLDWDTAGMGEPDEDGDEVLALDLSAESDSGAPASPAA